MPWTNTTVMDQREAFISKALAAGANIRSLCREYEISPTTAYKWLRRYRDRGTMALADISRRPRHSPKQTPSELEAAVLSLRRTHPAWGARKIAASLRRQGLTPPAASTITRLLHREGLIDLSESHKHQAWKRFEHPHPNDLWQMDFKGDVVMGDRRCHPLTVLDDHSRFNLGLVACENQQATTVRAALTAIFRSYGLPTRMTMDNGSPWGNTFEHPYTILTVWLMRLGIEVSHSRPYHPQTQGKDERFHRTLKAELLSRITLVDLEDAQARFDRWRHIYNMERPHEALAMQVPAYRYRRSERLFPETLPPIEYPAGAAVRAVQQGGSFFFEGRIGYVSKAFARWKIALLPTDLDGVWEAYFCHHKIAIINLHELPRSS